LQLPGLYDVGEEQLKKCIYHVYFMKDIARMMQVHDDNYNGKSEVKAHMLQGKGAAEMQGMTTKHRSKYVQTRHWPGLSYKNVKEFSPRRIGEPWALIHPDWLWP